MTTAPPAAAHRSRDGHGHPSAGLASALQRNLEHVIRGKPEAVRLSVVSLLSGGHLLIEDVPGVGKTLLAKALARSIGGTFRRIQGTPDLLPSDITGITMYDREREEWRFRPGAIFANVVLVDEINRSTPRTQSALLEAMEERQVTVDGRGYPLPDPFFVVATQNPSEHAGTFPLVEGQRDRFSLVLSLGHPGREAERALLVGAGGNPALDGLGPVAPIDEVARAVAAVSAVHCSAPVADYILDIAQATRAHPRVGGGASPRASLGMLAAARAHAVTHGRGHVLPDDVQRVAASALAHRIGVSVGGGLDANREVIAEILRGVPVPT